VNISELSLDLFSLMARRAPASGFDASSRTTDQGGYFRAGIYCLYLSWRSALAPGFEGLEPPELRPRDYRLCQKVDVF